MGKHRRPSANPGPRSGTGAGSALQEMLRRQAQNPRPGTAVAQSSGTPQDKSSSAAREDPPRAPDRHRY
jgi:hypothetical protein